MARESRALLVRRGAPHGRGSEVPGLIRGDGGWEIRFSVGAYTLVMGLFELGWWDSHHVVTIVTRRRARGRDLLDIRAAPRVHELALEGVPEACMFPRLGGATEIRCVIGGGVFLVKRREESDF
jgi:hypothetical protein